MKTSLRHGLTLLLAFALAATTSAATYIQPTYRMVLNEVITGELNHPFSYPLYLDRHGTYFAELIMEPAATPEAQPSPAPTPLAFTVKILKKDKVLVRREFNKTITPDYRGEVLFWLESPYDLPMKKELNVVVEFHDLAADFQQVHPGLRLQITRKADLPGMFRLQ